MGAGGCTHLEIWFTTVLEGKWEIRHFQMQVYLLEPWNSTNLFHLCIFQTPVLQKDWGALKRPGITSKTTGEKP